MVAFAQPSDIANRWRPLTSAEEFITPTLLEDASRIMRAQYPGIDAQITSGALDPQNATQVAAGMVKRALIAPMDGVDSSSETMGPYSTSQRYSNALRNLFPVAADDLLIRGYQPRAKSVRYA
jgi:hypothetical protein